MSILLTLDQERAKEGSRESRRPYRSHLGSLLFLSEKSRRRTHRGKEAEKQGKKRRDTRGLSRKGDDTKVKIEAKGLASQISVPISIICLVHQRRYQIAGFYANSYFFGYAIQI